MMRPVIFGDTRTDLTTLFTAINAKTGAFAVTTGNNGGLDRLDGSNGGFAMTNTFVTTDSTGTEVTGIGDFNADGFDDFAISGPQGGYGITRVVFGHGGAFTSLDLATAFDTAAEIGKGFQIISSDLAAATPSGDLFGASIAGAGDVNGDGYDDLIIGEEGDSNAYILFGAKASDLAPLLVEGIDPGLGFFIDVGVSGAELKTGGLLFGRGVVLNGGLTTAHYGRTVAGGGDLNGDGYDDVMVGGHLASPATGAGAGQTYVVYGQDFSVPSTPTTVAPGRVCSPRAPAR